MAAGGEPLAKRMMLTAAAASVAELVTYPIDMTKTRLQLLGEQDRIKTATTGRVSVRKVIANILRTEGPRGFYRGLSPGILRHCIYSTSRILLYEKLRSDMAQRTGEVALYQKAIIGGTSGLLGQALASPADLVKVRMQADGRNVARNLPARYSGIFDAFSKIVRSEGLLGLYAGLGPNLTRAALVNVGELTAYDSAKHFILGRGYADNVGVHASSAFISGFFATLLSCPADVVKSRIMADNSGRYRNMLDCFLVTVKNEGVTALYKGFLPSWIRLAPWQLTFWVVYEELRKLSGMKGF